MKALELIRTFKTFKARQLCELFIQLSHGNKKLKNNKRVNFLVWNLPAVITCPDATKACILNCYARKAERAYPSCKPARVSRFEISRQEDFTDRMIFTILTELARPVNKNRVTVFRIHESGDFYNREYAEKWLDIMRFFENDKRIVFVAYTKSVKFFDGVELPNNFALLASVWHDTSADNLEIIARNNFRIYTAYDGEELETALQSGFSFCPCKDCGTCGKCWNNFINSIVCKIH